MRAAIAGLASAQPIGDRLPSVYLDDEFTQRFTQALDEVLAPVFTILDSLACYFDPYLTPPDMLDWLSGWVALPLDESWSLERRRELIAHAVELHRWRGTRRGLAAHVRLLTGGQVTVVDNGGVSWSRRSGGPLPGNPTMAVEIQIRPSALTPVNVARLKAIVTDTLPAHVPATIKLTATGRAQVPQPPPEP